MGTDEQTDLFDQEPNDSEDKLPLKDNKVCTVCGFDYPKNTKYFQWANEREGRLYSICKRCTHKRHEFKETARKGKMKYPLTVEGMKRYYLDRKIVLDRWESVEQKGFFDD